ncbi:CsbD family protein [Roseomonas gilardii subsp. gilardii]|jgi:uncharacterized protein YjbJ (UPF0337 family)|uniref:CsbD family protein n=1 Tax=Roseomonas gilardii TaxID=257708 RepID=A0A1L7AHD8_9PROT|nr:CsbD family protein [Roseomonas gilardii]PZP47335.1 MAG: CsbD family protein [Azospirillum brasilense]APT58207.1 general stress protein CsbD [Roseomonas gilardii]MDT8329994.1 CsbD family protein [Roseomonas gilardii]PZR11246.1 MAG: CsbD family protein [Azospirillum brasilense]UPG72666.1 CsbD family protein [Roseomonas gilardii subsp. gilardii]
MDEDRIIGAAKQGAGRLQSATGELLGDSRMQARGDYYEAEGRAENALGGLADTIREQPLTAALIAVGIGWLIGRLRII